MKKKLLAILPILCALLCVFALGASAEPTFTEIGTADELASLMANNSAWDGSYKLTADIDLTDKTQSPIGTADVPFTGTFDGDGHTIIGLNLTEREEIYVGLFGYVSGATIKNLTVSGTVSNTGEGEGIGGIIGYAYNGVTVTSCVNNVIVNGSIDAENAANAANAGIGGVIGCVLVARDATMKAEITNCKNNELITGTASVGGIVGRFKVEDGDIHEHTIEGCANYGAISDTTGGTVGGIAGIVTNGTQSSNNASATISVINCYNKGQVTSSANYVGGIVGFFRAYTASMNSLTNCMNAGNVSSDANNGCTGGIVGRGVQAVYTLNYCYNTGSVTNANSTNVGPIVGNNQGVASSAGNALYYYNPESEAYGNTTGTQVTTENYGVAATFAGFDTEYWIFAGDGPMLRSFLELDTEIGSKEELLLLMNTSTAWGGNYTLVCDIDLGEDETQSPIGTADVPFIGTFDGCNYTITVNISSASNYVGLFGNVKGATISNLTVSGNVASTGNDVGGIVGRAYIDDATSTVIIENCKNYATVEGSSGVGGIIGRLEVHTPNNTGAHVINGCANYGAISDTTGGIIGGIAGILTNGTQNGTTATILVDNCYNKGSVTSTGVHVGGIVGYFRIYKMAGAGVLKNCMNAGAVKYTGTSTATRGTGGIIGYGNGASDSDAGSYTVDNCYNCGSVTTADGTRVGAIAAVHDKTSVTNATISNTYYLDLGESYAPVNAEDTQIEVTTANYGDKATFGGFTTDYWIFAADGPMLRSFLELDTVIGSEEELLLLMGASDKWNLAYTLARDLDMAAEDLYEETKTATQNPIGNGTTAFTGSFDGKDHKISGLKIIGTEEGTALFGVVGGTIDIAVTIENLTIAGEVTSPANAVGGIVGLFKTAIGASLTIENCINKCDVSITSDTGSYVGGIVGYVNGTATGVTLTITGCENDGDISTNYNVAGGILGYYLNKNESADAFDETGFDTVTVTKCKNTGEIDAKEYAGGIVGAFYDTNNLYRAEITLTELYNDNQSRIVEVPKNRGTIIGIIRNLAGGEYIISDLHDRAEPIQDTVTKDGVECSVWEDDGDRKILYCYVESESKYYRMTETAGTEETEVTYTFEAMGTAPECRPHWSNGCAPIGNVTGFSSNNKLEVTRVVAEMALKIVTVASVESNINATYCAFGYADHIDASRPYAYTDVIFNDLKENSTNMWVMTWSGPMLKEFAENEISEIRYVSNVSETADNDSTYTDYSAKLTIDSAGELIKLMNCHRLWDLDITLGANIDLGSYGTSAKQYYEGYTEGYAENGDLTKLKQMPIGRSLEKKFSGTFDGNSMTISGLNITFDEAHGTGLFGTVEGRIVGTETNPDGNVRNVRVPVVIKNLTVDGTVSNEVNSRAGGIVGQVLAPLEMTDCTSYVTVTSKIGSAGGILGAYAAYNGSYVTITNCDNRGEVSGSSYVGGIVGYLAVAGDDAATKHISEKLTITNCDNYRAVYGSSGGIGGIMGAAAMSSYQAAGGDGFVKITSCTNNAKVRGRFYVGGMMGYIHKRADCNPIRMSYEFTECKNNGAVTAYGDTVEGTVSGGSAAAGIVGFVRLASNNNFIVEECDNTAAINGVGRSGGIVGYIHNYREEKASDVTDSEGDNAGGDDAGSEGEGDMQSASTEGEGTTDSGSTGETGTMVKFYTSNVTYTITRCTNTGNVTVDGNTIVGGILGYYANMGYPDTTYANGEANKLIITYCKNEGTITASTNKNSAKSAYVGGIVGAIGSNYNNTCHAQVTVNTVYNAGVVDGTNYVGTIFGCIRPLATCTGENTGVTCTSAYKIYDVHGGGPSAKPVVGAYGNSKDGAVVFDYTRVYSENYNDLVGLYNGHTITITDCITDANNIFQLYEFVETSSAKDTWVMTANGPMLEYFANGITGYKEYTVSTPEDLITLMNTPALWGATVTLANDIDLTGVADQAPIGNSHIGFMGTFIGKYHTISGLNLVGSDNLGLFGYVESYVEGDVYKGAQISNLTVSGTVTSNAPSDKATSIGAGGIIGKANGVKITNCTNNVTVNGVNTVGGVAGLFDIGGLNIYPLTDMVAKRYAEMPTYNAGETLVQDCENTAGVTASGMYVGGIAGLVYATGSDAVASFIDNANSGAIVADQMAGGFAGRIECGDKGKNNQYTIQKFQNTGDVTVENGYAGGLAGILSIGYDETTGACNQTVTIDTILNGSNLYNRDKETGEIISTGVITSKGANGKYVGGIVGYSRNYGDATNLKYSNLMNTGVVRGNHSTEDAVGGIFGAPNGGAQLYTAENLYNRGSVTVATSTSKNVGPIASSSGNAMSAGTVKDLYAYNANDDTFSYVGGVNFVSAEMLGYSESFTQNPSDASYSSLAYSNGLAPFEVAYTKSATLPETYENWIMTSEGAELSYYHVHDYVAEDSTITCICIPEEKQPLSFRVTLLSEYVLEYITPHVSADLNPRMVFTSTDASGKITTTVVEPITYETSGANNNEDFKAMYAGSGESRYYFKVPGIAGKEMADTITGTFYYGEGDDMCKSNTVKGNLIAYYKVAKNAYSGVTGDVATTLTALLDAMVNYGAAAQEYFNYNNNTANLATTAAGATKVDYTTQTVEINEADATAAKTPVDGQTYSFYKQAANLDQRISSVLYFTYTGTPNLTDLTFKGSYFNVTGALITFRIEGSAMKLEKLDGQNVVAVYVDRPAAKDLRVEFTGALYSAGNQVSDKVTTSFECYARAVETDSSKDKKLKALCRSILAYSDAAKAYFDAYWDNILTDAESK